MKTTKMAKRIAALLMTAALTVSVGMTAFAASDFTSGTFTTEETTFTFRKDIVVLNDGGAAYVYTPDITYTYSVAPANVTAGTEVTDSLGNSIDVKNGVLGGVTLTDATVVFTSTRTALTDGKAAVSDDIFGSVDLTKFSAAGIYRYVITETVDKAELTKQGISRDSSYQEKRYLDVYISNDDSVSAVNGLKVSGYVLFVAKDENAVINYTEKDKHTIVGKTEGFVDQTELTAGGAGQTGLADAYYTYNLTVQVDILGSLADETQKFPVSITTASRGDTTRAFDYDVTVGGNTTPYTGIDGPGIVNPGGKVGTAVSTELAKGDSITLYGLPADTFFNVTETNNSTDTYSITVKADNTTLADKTSVSVDTNGKISAFDANAAISNYMDYTTTDLTAKYKTILFENTLNDVSLTGVVLRIAPYAILLAAAVVLGIFYLSSRKKKASKDVL